MCDHITAEAVAVMVSSHNFRLITSGGYIELGARLYKQPNTQMKRDIDSVAGCLGIAPL